MTDPISATTSALAAFNHASNIIKAIFDLKIDTSIIDKLNILSREIQTLYGSNLSLQEKAAFLVTENENLKKEIARFEAWENETKRYKLKQIQPPGVFAYALKEFEANGEPAHWICADCYNARKKFILSSNRDSLRDRIYRCTNCGFSASIHDNFKPEYV